MSLQPCMRSSIEVRLGKAKGFRSKPWRKIIWSCRDNQGCPWVKSRRAKNRSPGTTQASDRSPLFLIVTNTLYWKYLRQAKTESILFCRVKNIKKIPCRGYRLKIQNIQEINDKKQWQLVFNKSERKQSFL